jgi:hypothetical protein
MANTYAQIYIHVVFAVQGFRKASTRAESCNRFAVNPTHTQAKALGKVSKALRADSYDY